MESSRRMQEFYGHRRQPALGKAMPVTALLLNLSSPGSTNHPRGRDASIASSTIEELPPQYFTIYDDEKLPPNDGDDDDDDDGRKCDGQIPTSDYVPCLRCTQIAPEHLTNSPSAINEMCRRLCTDNCRHRCIVPVTVPGSEITTAAVGGGDGGGDEGGVGGGDIDEMRRDFREKYEIAEALAKTSAMTSTVQMKQRLAARKLEMEMESATAAAALVPTVLGSDAAASQGVAIGDALLPQPPPPLSSLSHDYEPPRDLLLYLVRMGSFNSAPKINNVDSQDDGLELPKGLSTAALLQHVHQLRGGDQSPLLSRYFLKPPQQQSQIIGEDVTDGIRSLKLNTVSRVCSAPVSDAANHIRLLQWNILSQTLGQNNDGFVRCPEDALTWDHRKYLIVQEILQNQPDVICLQEVDHFKFLQTVLGNQNYEGIFYPKPDSPCLYIEENNGPDGCAIFYKRDKFNLQSYDTRILEVWRVQSNQVAIAARLQVKATGREFCVCTTHLKARHGALLAKLRNEQGRDLIRFVKQFASDNPVLLCGDFNAEPVEPIYATMLNCELLKLSSAYADVKMEEEGDEILQEIPYDDPSEIVAHSMKREPPYTTWKIREEGEECHTIDYVFYTPEQLKVKNCLEFPPGEEIGKNRTPSYQYPSDHFSLVCDFELLEEIPEKPSHGAIQ